MILRTGIDLVEISRLADLDGDIKTRFLKRVFTDYELDEVENSDERLSGRFAAKEAVAKALGCGIGPVKWQEIEVRVGDLGAPQIYLYGAAKIMAEDLGLTTWSVSISHTHNQAAAMVVAMGAADSNEETDGGSQ
ncbi:MAG: holo-ACP synthase [Anaerolineaceae bacterium]|nr:holo-ACP synthase [Anaerolineaceae bacterium]